MTERIIIAGAGGQGIMLLGKILADAAMRENKFVTFLPSYGAEVRGGTSHCMVVISDNEIGSPYVEKADSLIIMNAPSFERFKNRIRNKGLLLLNSSLVARYTNRDLHTLQFPFTDMAIKLGNIRVANTIALGCFIANKKIVSIGTISKVMLDMAGKDRKELLAINQKALEEAVAFCLRGDK
jgi:2-oxoglutarate ferredoxin oxidoreductase subunit gamma